MVVQFIINGLITGVLYSLVAVGFALVYNTTKLFHLVAAALYVFAAFMFYSFAVLLEVPLWVAAVVAIFLTMGLSLLTDVSVYRPLKKRHASGNVAMIASIGMMTVIVNVLALFYGKEAKVIDNQTHQVFSMGNVLLTTPQMWQLVVGGCVLLIFLLFLGRSNLGVRLKALSADSVLYETLGYDINRTRTWVFLFSGAFIALGSCLTVYDVGMDLNMGMNVLINAMVAMIIGGVGRLGACVIGGLSLGLLQSLTVYLFSANWQSAVTFLLLLLLLLLRPQGIAGYKQRVV